MSKILKLLVPGRKDLSGRWWHRLVNVLIYGTTILVLIVAGVILVSSSWSWLNYSYPAFSFETAYETTSGKVVNCRVRNIDIPIEAEASCGGNKISTSDFIARYNKVIRDQFGSQLSTDCGFIRNADGLLAQAAIKCMREKADLAPINTDYIEGHRGDWLKIYSTTAKENVSIVWGEFFKVFGLSLLMVVGWFIFWMSIIYRAVLYIVFGKQKKVIE